MHIIKNERPLWQTLVIKTIAIVLALLVSALFIIVLTGLDPLAVFKATIKGTFSSSRRFFSVLRDASFLFMIALGLTPAFKMNFMNNGAEGQVLMGALGTAAVMINLAGKVSNLVLLMLMLMAALILSMLWGAIPAFFKVRYGTNETLFTLMMNYIAMQIVEFCIDLWDKKQSHVIGVINSDSTAGWLPSLFGNQYMIVFIATLLMAAIIHIYMNYSKQGYEIEVVGESHKTAKYAGINVNAVTVRTVIISAMICGLAGFFNVSGISHTLSASTAGGKGFTAIIVAWLGKFNVVAMALISFMLQFLSKGAMQIASDFNLNDYIANIVVAIILFFIIASEFFCSYSIVRSGKEEK